MRHPLRRIVNKFGIDITKHRNQRDSFDGISSYGIKTVIDIGADIGQFAKEAREKIPQAQIYSFEPLSQTYKDLVRNMSEDTQWKSFNYGLGSQNQEMKITLNPHSPSSSLLEKSEFMEKVFPHTQGGSIETIKVRTLDSMAQDIKIEGPLLVKLDVQGYESEVIKGGVQIISKARVILIETSFFALYKQQPLFDDIYNTLRSLGFSYHGSLQTKRNPKTGENLFEDAIFIKKD